MYPGGFHAITAPDGADLPQSGMDNWTPEIQSGTPHASAPALSWCTEIARAGHCIDVNGYQFSDDTELRVYGESSFGKTALLTCEKIRRNGDIGVWRLPDTMPIRAFMLLWPYDPTYGYGYPITINAPEIRTINCDMGGKTFGIVGDRLFLGGINLARPDSWIYLYPVGGGDGVWITPTAATDVLVEGTIPDIDFGEYEVWIHNGGGGELGWHKSRRNLTVGHINSLGQMFRAINTPDLDFDFKDFTDIHGGGPGTGDSMVPAWNALVSASFNATCRVQLEEGIYHTDGDLMMATGGDNGCYLKGAGEFLTTIKNLPSYSHDPSYGVFRSGLQNGIVSDLNLDFSDGLGTASGVLVEIRKLMRVTVNSKGFTSLVTATSPSFSDCTFIGGQNTGAVVAFVTQSDMVMRDSEIQIANYADLAITSFWSSVNILVKSVTARDYGVGDGNCGYGRLYGTGFYSVGLTITDCETVDLVVHASDSNRGEQILMDDNSGTYVKFSPTSGTATTITVNVATLAARPTVRAGASLACSNATSGSPVITGTTIPTSQTGSGWYVRITAGTNAIVGTYPASNSGGNIVLTGAIGTNASLSGISWELCRELSYNNGTDLASSDATGATPTISGGAASVQDGEFIWITAGTNIIPGLYQKSGGKLDRPFGTVASVSGGTWAEYTNCSYNGHTRIMTVLGGKGEGQIASIVSTAMSGNSLVYTFDRAFKIPLDSTSQVYFGNGGIDWAISKNTLAGDGNNTGASCGLQLFTAAANIHFWENDVSGVNQGFSTWGAGNNVWGGYNNSPAIRHYFCDNTFDNVNYCARVWQGGTLEYGQDFNSMVMIRDNVFTNVKNRFWWLSSTFGAEVCMQNNIASGDADIGIYGDPEGNAFVMIENLTTTTTLGTAITGTMTYTADPAIEEQFVGFDPPPEANNHYWRFDESDGTTATDEAGSATATFNISTGIGADPVPAISFDNPYSVAAGGSLQGTFTPFSTSTTWSLAFWLQRNNTTTDRATIFSDAAGNNGLYLRGSAAGGSEGLLSYWNGSHHPNNTVLTNYTWVHVAVVVDAGELTFYLNGVADGTASGITSFNAARFFADDSFRFIAANIDDMRFYDLALTSEDVVSLAAGENIDFVPPFSNSIIKYENFEGVTAPALPGTWTFSGSIVTTTDFAVSGVNSVASTHNSGTVVSGAWPTTDGNDGDAQVSMKFYMSAIGSSQQFALGCRSVDANNGYFVSFNPSSNQFSLGVVIAGSLTWLVFAQTATLTTGIWYRVTLKCLGDVISVRVQRDSDGYYLTSSNTWQVGVTNCVSVTDSTPGHPVTTGSAGFSMSNHDFPSATVTYGDDFLFEALT